MRLPNLAITTGSLLLVCLLVYRIFFWPLAEINSEHCFIVALVAGLLLSLGVTSLKQMVIPVNSPWGAWALISSMLTAVLCDITFQLGYFGSSEVSSRLIVLFTTALLFVGYGWWCLFENRTSSKAIEIPFFAFAGIALSITFLLK